MRQAGVGIAILVVLMIAVPSLLVGWRFMPGLLGEWVGAFMGIITTPFIMETFFATLGLVIVILINNWRKQKDGDEFVYLEEVTGPDVPKDLPDQAKWAVYREKPLDAAALSLHDQAQGALAIGDHAGAAELIAAMEPGELDRPEVLVLRRDLALATGRTDLAREYEEKLRGQ